MDSHEVCNICLCDVQQGYNACILIKWFIHNKDTVFLVLSIVTDQYKDKRTFMLGSPTIVWK